MHSQFERLGEEEAQLFDELGVREEVPAAWMNKARVGGEAPLHHRGPEAGPGEEELVAAYLALLNPEERRHLEEIYR